MPEGEIVSPQTAVNKQELKQAQPAVPPLQTERQPSHQNVVEKRSPLFPPQSETVRNEKAEHIEQYRDVIGEITTVVERDWLADTDEVTGSFNGMEYAIRAPHLRRGKHA